MLAYLLGLFVQWRILAALGNFSVYCPHLFASAGRTLPFFLFFFLSGILPGIILIPALFFIPESPRWLVSFIKELVLLIFIADIVYYWLPMQFYLFCPLYLGANGDDRRFWIFFASLAGIWCWYFCWSEWNKGNPYSSSAARLVTHHKLKRAQIWVELLGFESELKMTLIWAQLDLSTLICTYQGDFLFHLFEILTQVSWICSLQRSVASSTRRTTVRMAELKQRRYYLPLTVWITARKFFLIFSSIWPHLQHCLIIEPDC